MSQQENPERTNQKERKKEMANRIVVTRIQPASVPSAVKAHADVRIEMDSGALNVYGFSVVQSDGKPVWVGFPQKPGKNGKRYFPVLEMEGGLKEMVVSAILDAYDQMKPAN